MKKNTIKESLKAKEASFCFSVRMARTVNIVALAKAAGYHGFYVDLQHSSISVDAAAQMCVAALYTDITALVRVPSLEPGLISRMLDAGAQGIIAPDVRSAADAEALVRAALIAPLGDRSMGSGIPDPRFQGVSGGALPDAINEATLLIAMIETEEAAAAAADIIGVAGIDAIQIGSNDLTTSMGIAGQYGHARMREVYARVIEACNAAGKPLIIGGIRKADALEPYIRMGAARCYFTGADTAFMLEGATLSAREAASVDAAISG